MLRRFGWAGDRVRSWSPWYRRAVRGRGRGGGPAVAARRDVGRALCPASGDDGFGAAGNRWVLSGYGQREWGKEPVPAFRVGDGGELWLRCAEDVGGGPAEPPPPGPAPPAPLHRPPVH